MARVAFAVAVPFLMLALAGCADDSDPLDQVTVPESIEDVQVTDTTGALRGIVLDEKITPLAGVSVAVAGVQEIQTTAGDGGFVFSGLAPGDYFITATKLGYQPIQSSGSVTAGDENPPLVKIILAIDNTTTPFVEIQNWKAFLQCGVGFQTTVNPCLFTGSDNVHYFAYSDSAVPMIGQAEAVWSGTQPLGNTLWFEMAGAVSEGSSPLVVRVDQERLDDRGGDDNSIMVRVFAGDDSPTVVVNQAYDVYVLYFYNFVPRESYIFAVDGPCEPPTSCM